MYVYDGVMGKLSPLPLCKVPYVFIASDWFALSLSHAKKNILFQTPVFARYFLMFSVTTRWAGNIVTLININGW